MSNKVKNLYLASRNDTKFVEQLKIHEKEFFNKKWYQSISDIEKSIIASIYMGYLIARNEYNESCYI